MSVQGFSDNPRLRASDADRDRAATVINAAMAEGRLTADEHSERLDAIYAAKTQADIVPLLDDLPGHAMAVPAAAPAAPVPATGRGHRILAVFGGASRKGNWHVEPVMDITTVFGGAELDFREAVLPGREISIRATVVFGGLSITVPPEMRVIDSTAAIFGGTDGPDDSPESAAPDAPVLRITGKCVFGGMDVKRKSRKLGEDRDQRAIDYS